MKKRPSPKQNSEDYYMEIARNTILSDPKYGKARWLYNMFDEDMITYGEIKNNFRQLWKDNGDTITDPDSFFGNIKFKININIGHQISKDELIYFERLDDGAGSGAYYKLKTVNLS